MTDSKTIGYRVAQVRVVFKIPERGMAELFPLMMPDRRLKHLAYVEWFTPLTTPHRDHGLYRITQALRQGARLGSIIPVDELERSCHLYPDFGPTVPRDWTSSTVLELCPSFFVNAFSDKYMYKLLY